MGVAVLGREPSQYVVRHGDGSRAHVPQGEVDKRLETERKSVSGRYNANSEGLLRRLKLVTLRVLVFNSC